MPDLPLADLIEKTNAQLVAQFGASPVRERCGWCNGSGQTLPTLHVPCTICAGRGYILTERAP